MTEAPNSLRIWRTEAGLTQSVMAQQMGIKLRTYEDLEGGRSPLRAVHLAAARFALIELLAIGDLKRSALPDDLLSLVDAAAAQT